MVKRTALPVVIALLLGGGARAAEIRGMIKLPETAGGQTAPRAAAYWLLPNDALEAQPPLVDARTEMIVALQGSGLPTRALVKPAVRIEDARFIPTVLPVPPNAKVVFTNQDTVPHILESIEGPPLRTTRLSNGSSFTYAFGKAGVYRLHSSEVPHMVLAVVVPEAPLATVPDAGGAFSFLDIPAGSYTLRVWYRGKWIHSQAVAAPGKVRIDVSAQQLGGKE